MPGDDQPSSATRSQTASRPTSPVVLLDIPEEPPRRETRDSSPSGIPSEVLSRAETQLSRLESIRALKKRLPKCAPDTTLAELKVYSAHLDDLHKAFQKEHSYFEVAWPRAHRDHLYYVDKLIFQETELCFDIKLLLGKLKEELMPFQPPQPSNESTSAPGKLPELAIPTFNGDYLKWPAYCELFDALIVKRKDLTDIERLQYLHSSLEGEPAEKVEALPLKGDSFATAWRMLNETYANKRLFIQAHLDKLFDLKPVVTKNAPALKQLISTVERAQASLSSLGVTTSLGDCLLVHLVARLLDKSTREAWETSMGSSMEYPTFQEVKAFVCNKVRALERSEAPPSQGSSTSSMKTSSTKPAARKASSHTASQGSSRRKTFPCDVCKGDHFIVMCPQFRAMSVQERRKVVANNMLCYNCCGRHSSAQCKSPHKCKECGIQHHTMLHIPSQQKPAQTQPQTEASQSTSQQR